MVRLIPVDQAYFDLLERLAAHLTSSLEHLHELFADPARAAELVPTIKREEGSADTLMHDIRVRLDESFVTPFDREDIHALALSLDRVVDLVEDAAESVELFRLATVDEPAQRLAEVLLRGGRVLAECVAELRHPKTLLRSVKAVRPLVEEGDAMFQTAMAALFGGAPDPLEVIKRKALYDKLEGAIHECDTVADALESVALKHA